jgi:hypothetical protein
MANVYADTQYVLNTSMAALKNNFYIWKTGFKALEDRFANETYKTGDSISYRLPMYFRGGDGSTVVPENLQDRTRLLQIQHQFNVAVNYTAYEKTFQRLDKQPQLMERVNPEMVTLANKCEAYGAATLASNSNIAYGVGSITNTFPFNNLRAKMKALGVPSDNQWYCAASNLIQAAVGNSLAYNNFDKTTNRKAFGDGYIGRLYNVDFFESEFLPMQVAGVGSSSTLDSKYRRACGVIAVAPLNGATTLQLSGFTPGAAVVNAGDILEMDVSANVFFTNVSNKINTPYFGQFCAENSVVADGSGNATVTLTQPIYWSNTDSLQNYSAQPAVGAVVRLYASHFMAIMYHKNGLVVASPKLAGLDGGVDYKHSRSADLNASLRWMRGANATTDVQVERADVLAGAQGNGEYIGRLMIFNVDAGQ